MLKYISVSQKGNFLRNALTLKSDGYQQRKTTVRSVFECIVLSESHLKNIMERSAAE